MPPEDPSTNLPQPLLDDIDDLGMDAASLAADIRRHFNHTLGCDKHSISAHHVYQAVVIALRDRLMESAICFVLACAKHVPFSPELDPRVLYAPERL